MTGSRGARQPGGAAATGLIEPPSLSRRSFLGRAATAAAVTAAGGAGVLLPASPALALEPTDVLPSSVNLHLLRRATYGPTKQSIKKIKQLGYDDWLEQQLDPASIDDSWCRDQIADRFPLLGDAMEDAYATQTFAWDWMFQLGQAHIFRATWSKRQLFEVMVDFWSNHLNVTNPFDGGWYSRHDYDRTVIRKHAFGKFSSMLKASAKHPAMLDYLDNAYSSKWALNENYGREVLELHSVGVDAGYTEAEMLTSARIMTGLTIDWDTGRYDYRGSDHWTGTVQVLGFSSANGTGAGGEDVAMAYLDYLAHHPSTAHRLAWKLCRRFVADVPPAGLVDKLAEVYLDHDTAIVPVLRTLFRSNAFKTSTGKKVRRPLEDMIATLRILGYGPDADPDSTEGTEGLYWRSEELAHLPLNWAPPDGYPDEADAWRSAGGSLARWNMQMGLAAHWWPDSLSQPKLRDHLLPATLPPTHGKLIDALATSLVQRPLPTAHRAAVLEFLGVAASEPLDASDAAVRWDLPQLVALILASPSFAYR